MSGQAIDLDHENNLERGPLLLRARFCEDRTGLRDLLDHLLHDEAVVVARITRVHLDVVVRSYGRDLDGLVRRRLELAVFEALLLGTTTI